MMIIVIIKTKEICGIKVRTVHDCLCIRPVFLLHFDLIIESRIPRVEFFVSCLPIFVSYAENLYVNGLARMHMNFEDCRVYIYRRFDCAYCICERMCARACVYCWYGVE